VIAGVDADMVCLQGVGGAQPLADLVSALSGSLANTAIGPVDARRDAVVSDHAMVFARISWPWEAASAPVRNAREACLARAGLSQ
jgi:hypothetical protein